MVLGGGDEMTAVAEEKARELGLGMHTPANLHLPELRLRAETGASAAPSSGSPVEFLLIHIQKTD